MKDKEFLVVTSQDLISVCDSYYFEHNQRSWKFRGCETLPDIVPHLAPGREVLSGFRLKEILENGTVIYQRNGR